MSVGKYVGWIICQLDKEWSGGGSNSRPLHCERTSDESQTPIFAEFAELLSAVCTRVCTSDSKTGHADLLESLAAVLQGSLSVDDCRRMAELLASRRSEEDF